MSEAEREHNEHEAGRASESANCFTEAQAKSLELHVRDTAKIGDLVAAGRFVVTEWLEYYCRATDAFAGCYEVYRADFARSADAYHWITERCDGDEPRRFNVLPSQSTVAYCPPAHYFENPPF